MLDVHPLHPSRPFPSRKLNRENRIKNACLSNSHSNIAPSNDKRPLFVQIPAIPSASLVSTSLPIQCLRPSNFFFFRGIFPNSFLRDHTFFTRDQSLMTRDQTFFTRDQSLMTRDQNFFARDQSLMTRDQTFFVCDQSLMTRDQNFFACDQSLMTCDQILITRDGKKLIRHQNLITEE